MTRNAGHIYIEKQLAKELQDVSNDGDVGVEDDDDDSEAEVNDDANENDFESSQEELRELQTDKRKVCTSSRF